MMLKTTTGLVRSPAGQGRLMAGALCASLLSGLCAPLAHGDDAGEGNQPATVTGSGSVPLPQLVSAQLTLIRQHLYPLHSPYSGPLSLTGGGSTKSSYTGGVSLGWEPLRHVQFYLDEEKFIGAGVGNSSGLASLTSGEAVRAGAQGLARRPYVARAYTRVLIPLAGSQEQPTSRAEDQLATLEPDRRVEVKFGILAVNDDFDQNRYANGSRIQFENWSLINDTAWDFAADTRGYTTGGVIQWFGGPWTARLGIYRMPQQANAQPLAAITQARGQNAELDWAQPGANGMVLRLLAFQNVAAMGDYNEALLAGAQTGQLPSVQADDKANRHKNGLALNVEQPLADDGNTGLFARLGANDGHTESFAYTEMDRVFSAGAQVSGVHWGRGPDVLGIGYVIGGLSPAHRAYLAAGGQGFVLGDGRIDYGYEQVLEAYYRCEPLRGVQLSPDVQYLVNPGFNRDRGPARVVGIRLHLEY